MMKSKLYTLLALLLLCSCTDNPKNVTVVNSLPPIFPDYTEVTVPVGIAPLNFNVISDSLVECVDVTITGEKGEPVHSNGKWAKFDIDNWHKLLDANTGSKLVVSVQAKIGGQWYKYNEFNIFVSEHPLEEWGLTYRRIAPGYEVYSSLGIYQRDLSNFEEFVIIDNKDSYGTCLNCHTPNKTNPEQFVFHVRGPHGATMIQQNGKREWLQARNDALGGSMVYPYWHPSGKYCAFSTNQTHQAFHIGMEKRIEVFDQASDVFVYNVETHEMLVDTLLSRNDTWENTPVFSPDGKMMYFISAKKHEYPLQYKDVKYNLCSIPFDSETGTFGNKIDTLFNAVAMDKSLTWPKASYDGRYMMFTLADYGYFSIWHKESDIWLMDLATGDAKPLEAINSEDADSYHNWSENSRWIVFTSRRMNGLYSQLFISSIDEEGNATKPFLLPQENPWEYYDETLYSFNVPNFTKVKVEFDQDAAANEVVSNKRTATNVHALN